MKPAILGQNREKFSVFIIFHQIGRLERWRVCLWKHQRRKRSLDLVGPGAPLFVVVMGFVPLG
jgi:hypothetical protein